MTLPGFLLLLLLAGLVSFLFALTVTLLVHTLAWIFNLGRRTARHNPWN